MRKLFYFAILLTCLGAIAATIQPPVSTGGGSLVDEGTYYSLDKPLATADGVAGENLLTMGANQTNAQVDGGSLAPPGAVGIWGSNESGKLHFVNDVSAGGTMLSSRRICAGVADGGSTAVGESLPGIWGVGGDEGLDVFALTPIGVSASWLRYGAGIVPESGTARVKNFEFLNFVAMDWWSGFTAGEIKRFKIVATVPGTAGVSNAHSTFADVSTEMDLPYDDLLAAGAMKWYTPTQPADGWEIVDGGMIFVEYSSESAATGTSWFGLVCFDLEILD